MPATLQQTEIDFEDGGVIVTVSWDDTTVSVRQRRTDGKPLWPTGLTPLDPAAARSENFNLWGPMTESGAGMDVMINVLIDSRPEHPNPAALDRLISAAKQARVEVYGVASSHCCSEACSNERNRQQ